MEALADKKGRFEFAGSIASKIREFLDQTKDAATKVEILHFLLELLNAVDQSSDG